MTSLQLVANQQLVIEEVGGRNLIHLRNSEGRTSLTIEVTSGGARTVEATKWYEDLGVHRLLIKARSVEPNKLRDELLRFGDEVIARMQN